MNVRDSATLDVKRVRCSQCQGTARVTANRVKIVHAENCKVGTRMRPVRNVRYVLASQAA